MPRFLKPFTVLVAAMAAATAFGVGEAQASSCSKALIRDWYYDGRIDQTYQVHCYREALKGIPEDQLVYGTLREDLMRALQQVIRDKGGPENVTPETPILGAGGGGTGNGGESSKDESFFGRIARALGPDNADSLPVPLLVLGGLALLLIAAAGVSFLARRMQAKRAATDPPPAGPLG